MNATQLRMALKGRGYDVSPEKAQEIHGTIDHQAVAAAPAQQATIEQIILSLQELHAKVDMLGKGK